MKTSLLATIALLCSIGCYSASPLIDTRIIAYKSINEQESLVLKRYGPSEQKPDSVLPCAVFFFGGGWNGGDISAFADQAQYLAKRGMVAICAQYRTRKSHNVPPNVCLMDAKSAIAYLRTNAKALGIDPDRLAVGGGSAGGHLAAASSFCEGFNEPGAKKPISTRANALLLFNPVIDNGPNGYGHDRVVEYWQAFSPLHNVDAPAPPSLFLLGDSDKLIPVATGKAFKTAIENNGGRCELKIFKQAEHGFFNAGRTSLNGKAYFEECLQDMDRFLVELGYLNPQN